MRSASACAVALGQRAARGRQLRRDQHAVADRFAVAEAAVLGHRFERVAGGVAEVQDPPRPGFAFVGGDDVGLDAARLGDDRRQRPRASRAKIALRSRATRSNSAALDVIPYLITSYSPARNSRRGSVPSTGGSMTTACGW